jgi:hypothetical protein
MHYLELVFGVAVRYRLLLSIVFCAVLNNAHHSIIKKHKKLDFKFKFAKNVGVEF